MIITNYIPPKKLIIITGHFGSGKTNIAVNLALSLRQTGERVSLVDLDTVNPYFRAADSLRELEAAGVRAIVPAFANTNVDIPALPPDILSVFSGGGYAVFDVGGDYGAAALGRFRHHFKGAGYAMFCVINRYRPLTPDAAGVADSIREIEDTSRMSCTHLINNSNLGGETTPLDIEESLAYAGECSAATGLGVAFTSVAGAEAAEKLNKTHADQPFLVISDITKKIF